MKSILRVVLWLVPVVLAIIGPSTLCGGQNNGRNKKRRTFRLSDGR